MTFQNKSEEFVYNVTRKSFLSLWSYANPKKPDKNELCDVLTVFGSNVAIFSVKESKLKSDSDHHIQRWKREVIDAGIRSVYGAQKTIRSLPYVIRADGSAGLTLPSEPTIYRIVVGLGSQRKIPIPSGDYGKGFVHVFDEVSFSIIMEELDTAPDLFEYLTKKIVFVSNSAWKDIEGGEEDLLALYLHNGREFPTATNFISIGSGIWDKFLQNPQYINKKEADKVSIVWDNLIEYITKHLLAGTLEPRSNLSDTELALRQMASEHRYQRRLLGDSYNDFLQQSHKVRARLGKSDNATYVFLACPLGDSRQDRTNELLLRCFVARGKFKDRATVIGIATEVYVPNQGFSLDLIYMHKPEWTDEDQKNWDELQSHMHYFEGESKPFGQDEFPL
ncbi:MAG: hypothetical protein HYZ22_05410 [Chloroflexi bacterium]|nr:hypothetical protein [Chloroflexota bacterium]